jgi:hypothetical protein
MLSAKTEFYPKRKRESKESVLLVFSGDGNNTAELEFLNSLWGLGTEK